MDYLHKKNIIHRDLKVLNFLIAFLTNPLKPENLLLDADGNIKLCDFGWSAENSSTGSRETFCGTFDYMAPEMIQNEPHDFRLDIWCLGILLFELLHGKAPFPGKNDHEKCMNIIKNKTINFDVSNDAEDLIRRVAFALTFVYCLDLETRPKG